MRRPKEVQWFIDAAPSLSNTWGPETAAYIEHLEARVAELEAEVQRRDDADNADYLDNLEHTEH